MVQSFLITGCGRSGTQFTSKVLCALGIPCGHEYIFNPEAFTSGNISWPPEFEGDSSWLAAPFVGQLPSSITLFHQVRGPLEVVRSLLRLGLFSQGEPYKAYSDFVRSHTPGVFQGDEVERCFRYWLHWNGLIEEVAERGGRELVRYRIEDMDVDLLTRIGRAARPDLSTEAVEAALGQSNRSTHTAGDKSRDRLVTWDSLLDVELKQQIEVLAASYGYHIETSAAGHAMGT